MSQQQNNPFEQDEQSNQQNYADNDENYIESDFGIDYDLIFNDSKSMKKQHKNKTKKNARRRVDDYMEQRAFNKKMKELDNSFDD